ncbi:hypothetical protein ID866_5780 [Astraeus odoratus]|nr:hypothetical protein ID866_5780 [Astraeus odoratus]
MVQLVTAEHYDNVLGAKMRSLVYAHLLSLGVADMLNGNAFCSSGAIKRARLEKVEPMISYEAFVEDLDRGDSFTTSLIEVLVKEIAERRFRQSAADRGLIADRTARSLRRLSSSAAVYRERVAGRGTGGRRAMDHTDFLSQPPDELEVDEEDEDSALYGTYNTFVEGARLNTDLYEAYRSQHSWSNSSIPHIFSVPHVSPPLSVPSSDSSASDRVLPPLIEASPPPPSHARMNMWLPPPSGLLHSTLTRQNSIRRPGRTRTADFSEFTTQRRNLARQYAIEEDPTLHSDGSTATAPVSDSAPLHIRSDDAASSSHPSYRTSSSQARRFFPFGRPRRFEVIPTPRPATSVSEDWLFHPPQTWASPYERTDTTRLDEENQDERSQAPRLRRGGLRAPEAMMSRRGTSWLGAPLQDEPSMAGPEGSENVPPVEHLDPVVPRPVSAEAAAQPIGGS